MIMSVFIMNTTYSFMNVSMGFENSTHGFLGNWSNQTFDYEESYYYDGIDYEEYYDAKEVKYYVLSTFSFLGLLANFLCLLVIFSSKLRGITAGVYMAGLAVADFMVLFSEIIFWVNSETFGGSLPDNNEVLCQAISLIRYGSKMWSTFITITITVERFFVVTFPLKIKNIMTLKVSWIIVVMSAIFAYSLNFYGAYTHGLREWGDMTYCDVQLEHFDLYAVMFNVLLTGIDQFLAIIVLFTFTLLIIYKLLQARKFRQSTVSKNQSQSNKEAQVTAMVLAVAVLFLVCKIPYTITWSIAYFSYFYAKTIDYQEYIYIYNNQLYLYNLTVVNHAVNFFLYFIFGSNFRLALMRIFCCRQEKTETSSQATSVVSLDKMSKSKFDED